MKKLLLACAALLVVVSAYGQGRVAFANTSGTLVTTNDNQGHVGSMTGLDNFYIALYVGNSGSTSNQLVLAGVTTNSLGNGRFTGGNPFTVPVIGGVNYGDGRALSYQLRGWSRAGNNYPDYEAAFGNAGFTGASGIGVVTPTFSPTGAAALFAGPAGTLQSGFELVGGPVVPEPSSIALGLLGLGAIALFRRRK